MSDHQKLMKQCEDNLQNVGVNQRGGKKYMMVKDRMTFFRQAYGLDYGVITELLHSDGSSVCVKAQVIDGTGRVVGSGMAEEQRGGGVNKASALENCESSAIGRALASLGLHGGEYPTQDEIESDKRSSAAIDERKKTPAPVPQKADEIPFNKSDEKNDWEKWVPDQISFLEKENKLTAITLWSSENIETLTKKLQVENKELFTQLLNVYEKRKAQLQNKG